MKELKKKQSKSLQKKKKKKKKSKELKTHSDTNACNYIPNQSFVILNGPLGACLKSKFLGWNPGLLNARSGSELWCLTGIYIINMLPG